MSNSFRYLIYILSTLILFTASFAMAGAPSDYLIVDDLPFIGQTTDLSSYLKGLFQLGIGIAVTLAVVMIVINGIQYMFSDIPGIKIAAKNNLGNIVWGLLLAFSSWLILYTINPNLIKFDLVTSLEQAAIEAAKGIPPPLPTTPLLPTGPIGGPMGPIGGQAPDGRFEYSPNLNRAQIGHASPQLNALLSCMAGKVPGNIGMITSISDDKIASGRKTFAECSREGNKGGGTCAHVKNSHHYGKGPCLGSSYAVDIDEEQHAQILINAAWECNPGVLGGIHNGNHVHLSIGTISGCGVGE